MTTAIPIFRYKLTEPLTHCLLEFSKTHQYDDRHTFKEAWAAWVLEQQEIISLETRRLKELNYTGDITTKMFKSSRYYLRNKRIEKQEQGKREKYNGLPKEILKEMDKQIEEGIQQGGFKPADGFSLFCERNQATIEEAEDKEEARRKLKKTYKNRYYMFVHKEKKEYVV